MVLRAGAPPRAFVARNRACIIERQCRQLHFTILCASRARARQRRWLWGRWLHITGCSARTHSRERPLRGQSCVPGSANVSAQKNGSSALRRPHPSPIARSVVGGVWGLALAPQLTLAIRGVPAFHRAGSMLFISRFFSRVRPFFPTWWPRQWFAWSVLARESLLACSRSPALALHSLVNRGWRR